MAEPTCNDLKLPGCTPEPLMAYLKALGILRLVSEQKDPGARGWWKNDIFWLRSALDDDGLVKFFLEDYRPTPIVAPWAGGSGFFKKDNNVAVQALAASNSARVRPYGEVIRRVRTIIDEEEVGDKPKDADKTRLIHRYRREVPDEVVAWMDAAMVLQEDGQGFAPLLGTGGNDGRLDFTQNFMQRIVAIGLHNDTPHSQSGEWLDQALFSSRRSPRDFRSPLASPYDSTRPA
jgi:CRISPR-associated protein Csx17